MEQLLEELLEASQPFTENGKLADYIPELLKTNPRSLGIYVMRPDGKHSWAGDCSQKFTIQSVVKPILLLQALLWQQVIRQTTAHSVRLPMVHTLSQSSLKPRSRTSQLAWLLLAICSTLHQQLSMLTLRAVTRATTSQTGSTRAVLM